MSTRSGEAYLPPDEIESVFADIPDSLTKARAIDLAKISGKARRLYVERMLVSSHSPASPKRK